jgi:hypothetical protein
MKFFKNILPFLFIAVVLLLAIFLFIRIGKNNLFFNNSNNAANISNAEISAGESAKGGSKKQFKNIEANILSSIDFDTYSYGIDIMGGLAYVGRLNSFDIIDINKKNDPSVIRSINKGLWANKVIIGNGCLYLIADNTLKIVDTADLNDYHIISEIDFDGFDPKVIVGKDLLYIIASTVSDSVEEAVFYIVDVASKTHPMMLSSTKIAGPVYGMYLNDRFVYLSGSGTVYVAELSNNSKPNIISKLKVDGWVNDILVRGNIAFMVGNNGLTIWDYSVKSKPVILSTVDIGGYGKKLFLYGDQLIIFNNSENDDNNFLIADISDKNNFDLSGKISNVPIDGYPQDLKVLEGNLFLLSNEMMEYAKGEGITLANEVKSRLYILGPIVNNN